MSTTLPLSTRKRSSSEELTTLQPTKVQKKNPDLFINTEANVVSIAQNTSSLYEQTQMRMMKLEEKVNKLQIEFGHFSENQRKTNELLETILTRLPLVESLSASLQCSNSRRVTPLDLPPPLEPIPLYFHTIAQSVAKPANTASLSIHNTLPQAFPYICIPNNTMEAESIQQPKQSTIPQSVSNYPSYLSIVENLAEPISDPRFQNRQINQCYNMGKQFFDQGNYSEAIVLLSNISSTHQYYAHAQYYLGKCYYEKEEFHKAIEFFFNALPNPNTNEYAQVNLGKCYFALCQFQKSIEHFKKIPPRHRLHESSQFSIGLCHFQQKHYHLAKTYFRKITRSNQYFEASQFYLQKCD